MFTPTGNNSFNFNHYHLAISYWNTRQSNKFLVTDYDIPYFYVVIVIFRYQHFPLIGNVILSNISEQS